MDSHYGCLQWTPVRTSGEGGGIWWEFEEDDEISIKPLC